MNLEVEALGSPEALRMLLDEDPSPELWGRIQARRDAERQAEFKEVQ